MTSAKPIAYWTPKYWPWWLGFGLLWWIAKCPYRLQTAIGNFIGKLLHRFVKNRRHIVEVNLKLCFPHLNSQDRLHLQTQVFKSAGMGIVETAIAWWCPDHQLKPLLQVEGLSYVQEALSRGKGAILLGVHFMTLELAGRLFGLLNIPFNMVYRRHKNPLYDTLLTRARKRIHNEVIDRRDVRGMLKVLKSNQLLWTAPDQDYGRENSVFAPFFGVNAATVTGISKLAKLSKAPVIPVTYYRMPNFNGYQLIGYPPLNDFPSDDLYRDALQINQFLEKAINKHPDQYLWLHRRFKTRPEGEAGFY